MNPFAALKARALLGGGLLITLLAAVPVIGWPNRAGVLALLAYPLLLLWSLVLARRYRVRLPQLLGPTPAPDQAIAILALVPALVALDVGLIWLVYTPVSWISPDSVRAWLDRMDRLIPSNMSAVENLVFLVGAVVLAPIVEELVFRGLLLHRWSYKWGRPRGLILTSIAFALLHASPVNAFVLGMAFGLIYLSSGSLPLTMAAHALNNLIALKVLPLLGPGGQPGGDPLAEFQDGALQAAVMFGAGVVILWLGRRWYWPPAGTPLPYYRPGVPIGIPVPESDRMVGRNQVVSAAVQGVMTDNTATRELATLAGGCFWCLEAAFQQLRGVERVTSGYTGGSVAQPSYEAVCGGGTGHAEVVQLEYDPKEITFRDLLEVFFTIHDPTTLNRQGADVGTQYRSAIFVHNPEQRVVAEQTIAEYNAEGLWGAPIVTEVVPLTEFYPAEAYHRDYFTRNAYQPYCMAVVAPKVAKIRAKYAGRLKK
jgi:peptide-methionine (S)-S-oxide reductase